MRLTTILDFFSLCTSFFWELRRPFPVESARPSAKEQFLAGGSACDNERMARAEGPLHRLLLALLNKANLARIPVLELSRRERRSLQAGRVRHDAVEPDSFRRRLQRRRERDPRRARRALPHLLAADFCFHLSARLLGRGCRGSYPGFLCDDTGR